MGRCIPECEDVRPIDDTSAIFKIKFKVGYLSKTFELKAKLMEKDFPSHIKFTGTGQDAEITGSIDLDSPAPEEAKTRISYGIEIVAISVTGKTALAMLGRETVKKQTSEFAVCVKAKLEGDQLATSS